MKITVKTSGDLRVIGVLGRLEDARDRAELLGLLETPGPLRLEVYDADTLPAEVLVALARRQGRGEPAKLVAYHGLLTHCLMRLGLEVRRVEERSGQEPPAGVQALALGGSANSLDKILAIVGALPLAKVAVFVVQHVAEDQANLLDRLLQARTEYRVVMPQNLAKVEPGTVYVAPPGHHMKVAHGLVYLTQDPKVQYARPSIEVLFEALAGEYGAGALAILLCGYGADGVAGCRALRQAGACVLVEDPQDCGDAGGLPEGARQAGHFDHVLKLPALASFAAAAALGQEAAPRGALLDLFLEALWSQYGYDFRGYQRDSLERRLKNVMSSCRTRDLLAFQRAVFGDPALFQRMVAELTVGVTAFFRHPEQLLRLRRELLPYLESFPVLKVWSAGCATGEEAYSLAILLEEAGLLGRTRLFATDLNHYLLDLAKSGLYPAAAVAPGQANYAASGGLKTFEAYLEATPPFVAVRDPLRQAALIHQHSLVEGGVFNEFQLILCRNVLIYFDPDTQRKILRRFHASLHPNGFLVLGPQDGLAQAARSEGFVPTAQDSHIYRLFERPLP